MTITVDEVAAILDEMVDAYLSTDVDAAGLYHLYARRIVNNDPNLICPETKGWHQVSAGSCDLCGAKNLEEQGW